MLLKRCQILRDLDTVQGTGQIHDQIAHTYAVCPATFSNFVKDYIQKGIDDIVKYNISPNPVPIAQAGRPCGGRTHTLPAGQFRKGIEDEHCAFWKR
ncbi:helix-turn-helix domain-containing protein [Lachnospiraceae bacterium]|nr:helix-turn-helix domain-containing protein [Lachnospiraceae bacterium]